MKVFTNLGELLTRLHTERKLLHALFQTRKETFSLRYEEALELVASEKNLQLLIDYGIVRQDGEIVDLDDLYQRFFEEVLHLNEDITSVTVEENLRQLKNNLEFYLAERKNPDSQRKYVNRIMRTLRNIVTQAEHNTKELKRVIDDTYRLERNYEVKRQKLEQHLKSIGNISSLIRETERLLDDRKDILDVMTHDQRITRLCIEARLRFKDVFHSLIEHEHVIRDYLHQIDIQNKKVKRIRRLKYLKDQLTWEKATTVSQMLESCAHQLIETTPYYTTKLSLARLRDTDWGLEAIDAARKAISRRKELKQTPQIPLKAEELETVYEIADFVDTDAMAEGFFASGGDLYSFVKHYRYERPTTLEQRVEYYTEIILNHHDRLRISDEWRQDGNIEYPLIYGI